MLAFESDRSGTTILIDWQAVMALPRGRYNGKRIVGVDIRFSIDVMDWLWVPYFRWKFGQCFVAWLAFSALIEKRYEWDSWTDK